MKRTIPDIKDAAVDRPEQDFDAFFRKYSPLVFRTAFNVTGNREDAQDVTQTVFTKVLQLERQDELAKNVKGYLYQAAFNEALRIVKARQEHNRVGEEECSGLAYNAGQGTALPEEICQRLWKSLEKLGPEAAAIFVLRYEHDYTDAEIAKMLGLSRAKVAVTLYRSRARLKRLMGGESSAAAQAISRAGRNLRKKSQTSFEPL